MKRSTQVALLLMGVAGIGASAYAFTKPRPQDCVPAGSQPPASARAVDKDSKLEPCPPRQRSANTGYYRSYHWYGSGPSHWSTPIFARRSAQTSATTTNSPTQLGFTNRPGGTTTTTRPSTSTSTTTTRTGFGTIGRSVASHSTSS